LDSFFHARYYENSHFNFITFFMWREANCLRWAVEDDVLYFSGMWKNRPFMTPPFCAADKLPTAIERQIEWFHAQQVVCNFYGLEQQHVEAYRASHDGALELTSDRADMDYVYNTEDLIKLAGRRYHTKKNHFNAFWRSFPEAEYLPVTEDIVPECKLNVNTWAKLQAQETPDDPYIEWERRGIVEVLNDFAAFGIKGAALRLGKRIVAFTFGEQSNSDTVVIHVEKAAPDVRGAFTAINREFLAKEWAEVPFVNRQEDMGLDGLRQAKESYRPCRMIEKWQARERV